MLDHDERLAAESWQDLGAVMEWSSKYRCDLVKQRKRVVNRLRWHVHELDPPCRSRSAGCAATASSTPSPSAVTLGREWLPAGPPAAARLPRPEVTVMAKKSARPRRHRMRQQARRESARAWVASGAPVSVKAFARR